LWAAVTLEKAFCKTTERPNVAYPETRISLEGGVFSFRPKTFQTPEKQALRIPEALFSPGIKMCFGQTDHE